MGTESTTLLNHRIKTLVSSLDAVNLCKDKLFFPSKIKVSGFKQIPSFLSPGESNFRKWVIKERYGSGARGVTTALNRDDALNYASRLKKPIFQPYIEGKEFTAEGWVDKNGQSSSVVLRWREKVVNGESHLSTTFKNCDWERRVAKLFSSIDGLTGHCLAQCLVDSEGIINLIEINPRLGGASPLSLSIGLNTILWSLQEEIDGFCDPIYEPIYGAKLSKVGNLVFISK